MVYHPRPKRGNPPVLIVDVDFGPVRLNQNIRARGRQQ